MGAGIVPDQSTRYQCVARLGPQSAGCMCTPLSPHARTVRACRWQQELLARPARCSATPAEELRPEMARCQLHADRQRAS
jgi:hypothetical protein